MNPCPRGCTDRGVLARDDARHAAYHELADEQLAELEDGRRARTVRVERPPADVRARIRAELVTEARRNGRHAVTERPPWAR